MLNINQSKPNALEKNIHTLLEAYIENHPNTPLTITEAGKICNCSPSKISKYVKKMGFVNYKQFLKFLSKTPNEPVLPNCNTEITRLQSFLSNFDYSIIDSFLSIVEQYHKIVLFGYGPSLICAQYFEYKLRCVTTQTVISVQDEILATNLFDDNTLLIIFSTTAKFQSFDSIIHIAQEKKSTTMLIMEEFNMESLPNCDHILFLTETTQNVDLLPHEKSRSIFFIFIEEVCRTILEKSKDKNTKPIQ